MKSEHQRQSAAETMRRNWQDPAFRARVKAGQQAGKHLSGPEHPRWKGGYQRKDGRWTVVVNGKRMMRSRAVWIEHYPDNPILPGEHIHHRNGDPSDDRIENLEKIPAPTHGSLHHKGRQWSPEHRAKALASMRAAKRHFSVKSCGKAHPFCKVCAPEIAEKIRVERQRGWDNTSPERRAELALANRERAQQLGMSEIQRQRWAAKTPEERSAMGRKMVAAKLQKRG
jgi:hypothetical protein